MKAKIIETGKIINVVPMDGNWCDPSEPRYYSDEELDFSPATDDWAAYRREVAKDMACSIVHSDIATARGEDFIKEVVRVSIGFADELIKQLKEK